MDIMIEKRIAEIIEPTIDSMGFEIVRIALMGQGKRSVLQLMIDCKDGSELTVDHCVEVSHTVSAILDVEDPIAGEYNLEVSSPGIDRPLTRLKDFERYKTYEAKIDLIRPIDGRRRFRGVLQGVVDDDVQIKINEVVHSVPFNMIEQSKLVMSDALIERVMDEKQYKELMS